MIHTMDFMFEVKRSPELKEWLIRNLTEQIESSKIIRDFLLQFDFKEKIVHISCNNPKYPLIYKCPDLDWTFSELKELVELVCK